MASVYATVLLRAGSDPAITASFSPAAISIATQAYPIAVNIFECVAAMHIASVDIRTFSMDGFVQGLKWWTEMEGREQSPLLQELIRTCYTNGRSCNVVIILRALIASQFGGFAAIDAVIQNKCQIGVWCRDAQVPPPEFRPQSSITPHDVTIASPYNQRLAVAVLTALYDGDLSPVTRGRCFDTMLMRVTMSSPFLASVTSIVRGIQVCQSESNIRKIAELEARVGTKAQFERNALQMALEKVALDDLKAALEKEREQIDRQRKELVAVQTELSEKHDTDITEHEKHNTTIAELQAAKTQAENEVKQMQTEIDHIYDEHYCEAHGLRSRIRELEEQLRRPAAVVPAPVPAPSDVLRIPRVAAPSHLDIHISFMVTSKASCFGGVADRAKLDEVESALIDNMDPLPLITLTRAAMSELLSKYAHAISAVGRCDAKSIIALLRLLCDLARALRAAFRGQPKYAHALAKMQQFVIHAKQCFDRDIHYH